MMHRRLRRPGTALLALLLPVALACLPDRKSDAQLQELVAQPDTVSGDTLAPGCGNGKLEDNEQCDGAGLNMCSGCQTCHRRRVLTVAGPNDLAAQIGKKLTPVIEHAADGFSVELWFSASSLPGPDAAVTLLALAGAGLANAKQAPTLALLLVNDGAKKATYATCGYWPVAAETQKGLVLQGAQPIKVDTWHHLRCAWSGKDLVMRLWLDGEGPSETPKMATKPAALFDSTSVLAVGAVADIGKPHFLGSLDELRVVAGTAADSAVWKYRYTGNEPGTQLLIHMDEADGALALDDASVNAVALHQASGTANLFKPSEKPLNFASETCYGYSESQATCNSGAPFCK